MAKNRYKPNGDDGKTLSFSGKLKILEAVNRKLFRVEVWALNNEVNLNGWKYINLDSHLSEFEDIPLLTAYLQDGTIGDGHNYDTKVDPATGKEYVSFTAPDAERIVGWVPKNAPRRIERDGGTDWVVVTGYLWAWYSKELVDKIAGQGGGLDVSVETLVTKEHRENGVDVEEEYLILGITILGNGVRPAVPGANIQALAAMRASSERREILKAASLDDAPHGTNKPEKQGVRVNMLSKKRLDDLTAKFNGFTCIGASEDTKVLALLNESGDPHLYVSEDSDMGSVIPERIRQASATVTFSAGDDNVQTDFESALTVAMSRCNAAEKELKETKERLEAVEKSLSTAVNREKSRRLEAAKSACSDELARINQNRPEDRRFSDELCKDLMEKINNNEFTETEDADGNWTGDKAIRAAVKGLCMDEQMRMDAEDRKADKTYFQWGMKPNSKTEEPHTIGEKMRAGI